MSQIIEHCKLRHHAAMSRLRDQANAIVPPDLRYVIMILDGPDALVRELSWSASAGMRTDDVQAICQVTAEQIRTGGRHVAGTVKS